MEPIKPIEGHLKDAEGQSSALAEVVRARYWQQLAQKLPPVEASEEAHVGDEKHPPAEEQKTVHPQARHTYAEFEINQETREVLVRIFDAESGDLVRTIPPDELAKEIAKGNFQPNQLRRRAVFI
ncbi:MAG: hypothetical protein FOGNACKC_03675 [Anaerolineae bacterium]|nr:hypothetical protein [Anaerolineae bacterium]